MGNIKTTVLLGWALGEVLELVSVAVDLDEPGVVDALRVSREEAGVLYQSFVPRGNDARDRRFELHGAVWTFDLCANQPGVASMAWRS